MDIKNIILNIFGIILYQLIIFYLYMSGAYENRLLLLFILEIYTLIILMYNGQKLLAAISLVNIIIPVNFIFFLINIFKKNIKEKESSKDKSSFINKNKLLLRVSPIIVVVNFFLLLLGFIEFYASMISFKLEIIVGYIIAFLSSIFGTTFQDSIYYITKPLAIIGLILVICYYTYLISVAIYFIKRRQPLRAFKIVIFNFFTFSLYSILYLKNDRNILLVDENAQESFRAIHESNLNMNNFLVKRLLVNFFAIFMIIFLIMLMNVALREDMVFIKKNSEDVIEVNILGKDSDLTYQIMDEIGEGLYTVKGELRAGGTYLGLADDYGFVNSSLEGDSIEFYNLPVNEFIEASLNVKSIFDFQTFTITRQSEYIDYEENKTGVYKFDMNTIKRMLDEEEFENVSLYNLNTFTSINIYKYEDEYDVSETNDKTGQYNNMTYTKEQLLEYLEKKSADKMVIIN